MNLIKRVTYRVSVYTGISPALLASISMGSDVKADSMNSLVDTFLKKGLIQDPKLAEVLQSVDRAWFTKDSQPYMNKPTKILKGQSMTDPLTQFVTLQRLYDLIKTNQAHKRSPLRILDLGCGHGYMAICLWRILQALNCGQGSSVLGVDIHEECIQQAKSIKEKYITEDTRIGFTVADVSIKESMLLETGKFDIVTCGFFVDDVLHERLVGSMKGNGGGVWPISDQNEQRLYAFQKDESGVVKKNYIFSTLFSPQRKILDKKLEKYFVEYEQGEQDSSDFKDVPADELLTNKERELRLQKQKTLKKQAEEAFKAWQQEYKSKHGHTPSLQEIRLDAVGSALLHKLKSK